MTSVRQAQEAPPTTASTPPSGGAVIALEPRLSIIIPATDAAPWLDGALEAIKPCLGPRDELIVIREPAHAGCGEARNIGAAQARGDILVFLDADVAVHPDALDRIRRRLVDDPNLTAIFGAYDDAPAAAGVVSRFRNLLHHHVHSSSPGPTQTFWCGLGAIRHHAFVEIGGFAFARWPGASLEDVEIGVRMSRAGMRIEIDPEIRGCHLKHWTFRSMVYTDFARRGVPWTRLLIERREIPNVLNLRWPHRISSALTLAFGVSLVRGRLRRAAAALFAMLAVNRAFYALLARRRGIPEAALGVALHFVYHLTALASLPAGAAVHLRRSLMRGGDPRVARRPHVEPVSHDLPAYARRTRRIPDDELRLGLVGCGRLAERAYVQATRHAGGVRLAAVADIDLTRCTAVAPGAPAFASVEDMIASGRVDAIVVATPAASHLQIAAAASAARLPALVEKPPAATTADAIELAGLELPPWIGFNRRFEPAVAALARLVPPGEPLEFDLAFAGRRVEWDAYDGSDDVLLGFGPHMIDLARILSGAEVNRVRAQQAHEHVSLELDLGERGRALVTCAGDEPWDEVFTVRDSTGRTLGSRSPNGPRSRAIRLARTASTHPLVYSLARQLEAFAVAAHGYDPGPLATAVDGVAVMATIDAARSSSAVGGDWVDVALATGRQSVAISA